MGGRAGKTPPALGAVLVGGRGSRLGGAKASALLGGRPLFSYPLAALAAAGIEAVVCAKPGEEPADPPSRGSFVGATPTFEPRNGYTVLFEPAQPRHPLCGIVAALRHGGGRAVVAVACDLPFVAPGLLELLARAPEPLVVPVLGSRPQPLVARYAPSLLADLEAALEREASLTATVESLAPRRLEGPELSSFGDPHRLLFNVNTAEDLRQAEVLLDP